MYWFRSKKLDHFVLFEKIFQTIKSILIIEVQRLKLNISIQAVMLKKVYMQKACDRQYPLSTTAFDMKDPLLIMKNSSIVIL